MTKSFNFSANSTSHEQWIEVEGLVSCLVLSLAFLVGAPGNLLVIWTIVQHVKQRSHTVVLILHLAVADLLVLITLPVWIYSVARSWVFGEVTCKVMVYIIVACMYSSVFLITTMSAERFLAVKYPFWMLRWKTRDAMSKCLVVFWVLAFALGIPAILTSYVDEEEDGHHRCVFYEHDSVVLEVLCSCLETVLGFIVPFFTITVCYCCVASQLRHLHSGIKQKSAILIGSVVVAFVLCWLPHHIINIIQMVNILTDSEELSDATQQATFISGALVFISSSVNPILYVFTARNFEGSLRKSSLVKMFQDLTSYAVKTRAVSVLGHGQGQGQGQGWCHG
ncbi:leukotriene B4 receptor 1-like [Chanos chanos]|uniref:Leukotriene B4 receptor 1-like n=1 Tax=Chanos chanos TaxID=29144 RepID=A0A6J2X0R5_CHACN|nr:leukotriene B4 receptor 1-like [Chanos chanos]